MMLHQHNSPSPSWALKVADTGTRPEVVPATFAGLHSADASLLATPARLHFAVGPWTISVVDCTGGFLQLAIAQQANNKTNNPQTTATVTVVAPTGDAAAPRAWAESLVSASALSAIRDPTSALSSPKRKRVDDIIAMPHTPAVQATAALQCAKRPRLTETHDEPPKPTGGQAFDDEDHANERISGRSGQVERTQSPQGFADLPDELKLHVFGFLPPASLLRAVPLVCQDWCGLVRDEVLWRGLFARHIGCGVTPTTSTTTTTTTSSSSSAASSSGLSWRGRAVEVLQHLNLAYADLQTSLDALAERQRRETDARMASWLAHTVGWMVEGGHAPLLASLMRDVARFAPLRVIQSTLSDRRFVLHAAKAGHLGVVATLVAFGADLGQALVLAAMNRDLAAISSVFRAYLHVKHILLEQHRRVRQRCASRGSAGEGGQAVQVHGRLLTGLVVGVRDAMRTSMNLAAVARDRMLLELLTNLCATDPVLREAHDFAQFVRFEGPLSSRRRHSQAFDDLEDEEEEEESEEEEEL